MDIVVSGIRPTGHLHLGNYFGAVKNFVKMQHEHDCFFFIADYHSLTTHPTPADLYANVKRVLISFLAAGIDPEKATLYIQSDIPEVAELYLLLNMNAYLGELERVASFKEKVRLQPNNVNAGLLTYPALMAADVLIHKAAKVPVGKDQEQHLEMIRTFSNRFNRIYNIDYFPAPVAFNFGEELIKIPGLDGSTKMSKSEGDANAIYLSDAPETIRKKIMRAVTDAGPTQSDQPKSQPIENLFHLMKVLSPADTYAHFITLYNNCQVRYGDMKKHLAEDAIAFTRPFRERIGELEANNNYLHKVAVLGAEKARASASQTIKEVREIIGFRHI
ncbi:MAG: tryptophan--tRNA ligase [Bacteroidales bacterium]|nr:tryptophan--tRNA ligase [Bacteroidales bacterium]MDZ4205153.1 tryptophan--tRNA ligase [Bacteroidales bacterium]